MASLLSLILSAALAQNVEFQAPTGGGIGAIGDVGAVVGADDAGLRLPSADPGLILAPVLGQTGHALKPEITRAAGSGQDFMLPVQATAQRPGIGKFIPPSGGAVRRVHVTVRGLDKDFGDAKKAEAEGNKGAVRRMLKKFFDADKPRVSDEASAITEGAEEGLPDFKGLSPEAAVAKLTEIAKAASPLDAPTLYRYASELALRRLGARQGPRADEDLGRAAARQAPQAVRALSRTVLEEAAAGGLSDKRKAKAFDALDFWNAQLFAAGRPWVVNLSGLQAAITQAAEAARAKAGPSPAKPKLRFEEVAAPGGKTALKAVVSLPEDLSGVAELPPLAEDFQLEADAAALEVEEEASLASAFQLVAPREGGLAALYHARRAAGRSVLSSLWLSLGRWTAGGTRGAQAWLARAWKNVLRAFGLGAAERLPDLIEVLPLPARPSPAGGHVLHMPRGAADAPVAMRIQESAGPRPAGLQARFNALDSLIKDHFDALELLSLHSGRMTLRVARSFHAKARAMAEAYGTLSGDGTLVGEADALRSRVEAEAAGAAEDEPLPARARELVVSVDGESLHRLIRFLHQEAIDAVGAVKAAAAANTAITSRRADKRREVFLLDLSRAPLHRGGKIASPALRALARALAESDGPPQGSMILQDHRFWGRFKLGARSAQVYADFLPPDDGGMLRVRYQERDADFQARSRLYRVAQLLYGLGFAVAAENGAISAVVDQDHQARPADELAEDFSLILQALRATLAESGPPPIPPWERIHQRVIDGRERPAEGGLSASGGLALSLGQGRSVTARITYSKEKAARGGFIFVSPYATPGDLPAIRHSLAIVTTHSGRLSRTAFAARELGIPAVNLGRAEWDVAGGRGLRLDRSLFLREGDMVRLDPVAGTVEVLR